MKQENIREAAEQIYRHLGEARIETLFDDREEAPGIKFKDADLIGLPLRLTLSAKTLKDASVEVKIRRTGEVRLVKLVDAVPWVREWIENQRE